MDVNSLMKTKFKKKIRKCGDYGSSEPIGKCKIENHRLFIGNGTVCLPDFRTVLPRNVMSLMFAIIYELLQPRPRPFWCS